MKYVFAICGLALISSVVFIYKTIHDINKIDYTIDLCDENMCSVCPCCCDEKR